ncbi:hypothetical protein ACH5RR_025060 [Cinchona calisaya]|uniref:Strictosidine synthase conserved region domain-containing protein n=1 Tax=Cinchona calisaya TaxID=153742 RepID=A0ABD2Z3K9_9GENT
MSKLSALVLLLSLPFMVLSHRTMNTFTIFPASGPESLVFDLAGQGPYTSVSDGRILKYNGAYVGCEEFAYASPIRTKEECDSTTDPDLGPTCGRPLGLGFNYRTEELYIADAYFGLCKVGPKGGLAKQLATSAEGGPFKWLDALEVDSRTGIVYFTDLSTKYTMKEITEVARTRDPTGRVMSYDPVTKEVNVLMSGLPGPGGLAVSKDSAFILISLYFGDKILKYWLEGPKAGTGEPILSVPGPTNIKRTWLGDFWIATNLIIQKPAPVNIPGGVKVDESGTVLESLTFGGIYNNSAITEVQEYDGSYYIGSLYLPFAATSKEKILGDPWFSLDEIDFQGSLA